MDFHMGAVGGSDSDDPMMEDVDEIFYDAFEHLPATQPAESVDPGSGPSTTSANAVPGPSQRVHLPRFCNKPTQEELKELLELTNQRVAELKDEYAQKQEKIAELRNTALTLLRENWSLRPNYANVKELLDAEFADLEEKITTLFKTKFLDKLDGIYQQIDKLEKRLNGRMTRSLAAELHASCFGGMSSTGAAPDVSAPGPSASCSSTPSTNPTSHCGPKLDMDSSTAVVTARTDEELPQGRYGKRARMDPFSQ